MAFKARIVLCGSQTFSGGGRVFKKGDVLIIDRKEDALYFMQQPEFSVSVLKDEVDQPKRQPKSALVSPELDLESDSEETTPDEDGEENSMYSRADLKGMSKLDLVKLGSSFDLDFDATTKKKVMVDEILKAQGTEDGE